MSGNGIRSERKGRPEIGMGPGGRDTEDGGWNMNMGREWLGGIGEMREKGEGRYTLRR